MTTKTKKKRNKEKRRQATLINTRKKDDSQQNKFSFGGELRWNLNLVGFWKKGILSSLLEKLGFRGNDDDGN